MQFLAIAIKICDDISWFSNTDAIPEAVPLSVLKTHNLRIIFICMFRAYCSTILRWLNDQSLQISQHILFHPEIETVCDAIFRSFNYYETTLIMLKMQLQKFHRQTFMPWIMSGFKKRTTLSLANIYLTQDRTICVLSITNDIICFNTDSFPNWHFVIHLSKSGITLDLSLEAKHII